VDANPIELAKALCIQFEGFYPRPYLCPAGVPTIGIGTTRYENGLRVSLTDPSISRERAEALLMWELQKDCLPRMLRLCSRLPELGPGAVGAILDFTYNLGSGNLAASTLRKRIQEGDRDAMRVELMRWVRGGGRVLPGLVRRRAAEARLL
jgi:lysozyme